MRALANGVKTFFFLALAALLAALRMTGIETPELDQIELWFQANWDVLAQLVTLALAAWARYAATRNIRDGGALK